VNALTASTRQASDYAAQMRQLLPPGAAFDFPEDGVFASLLLAFGDELARVDARASALYREADPRAALELLPDWERVLGLPDDCTGEPDGALERQVAVHQKITGVGGQDRGSFEEIAARLGYEIEIEEHRPLRAGALVNDRSKGEAWAFAWTARIQPTDDVFIEREFIAHLKVGDPCNRRIRGFGALDIECVIRRAAPAHTYVLFAYEVEPTAALYFDFTQ